MRHGIRIMNYEYGRMWAEATVTCHKHFLNNTTEDTVVGSHHYQTVQTSFNTHQQDNRESTKLGKNVVLNNAINTYLSEKNTYDTFLNMININYNLIIHHRGLLKGNIFTNVHMKINFLNLSTCLYIKKMKPIIL
jgi:hypothetical protein